MYTIIQNIINHTWVTSDSAQQYIYFICGAVIILLVVSFLDIIRHLFIRKR